jgi:hypothetical protein
MAVATNATNPPIQEYFFPIPEAKEPTTPERCFLPIKYSVMISGMLHRKRKQIQAIINAPAPSSPPFCAAIRGNRQIFPVPTAIPRALRRSPHREENRWFTERSLDMEVEFRTIKPDIKYNRLCFEQNNKLLNNCIVQTMNLSAKLILSQDIAHAETEVMIEKFPKGVYIYQIKRKGEIIYN